MGFGDATLFAKIELILIIVGFIIHLIGFAVPLWYSDKISSITWSGGLWESCAKTGGTKICSTHTGNTASTWLEATQAMEVLGFLCLLAALVLIILYLFVMSDKKILQLITFILCFCAFAFIFIGICIWAGEASGVATSYHFAFAFCIIAFIIALVAGVLGVLDWMGKGK